ncbi:MAG: mechanosensitive ion channel family protein [Clostridium sp.]
MKISNLSSLFNYNADTNAFELGMFTLPMEKIEAFLGKMISALFIIILMYFAIRIGNKIIEKFVEQQATSKGRFSLESQKALTIGSVLKSILKYAVYMVGISWIIITFFGGLSLAAAGIGGVALGFGAQSLVKDIINGLFILFEDQYGVGDHVTIAKYTGIVESIEIRTTVLRDFTGDLHIIPNGSIIEVTNHSRGNMRFIVDVEIAYESDIDKTLNILNNLCLDFEKNNEDIAEPIEVLGVNSLNASGVTIRIVGKAKPLSQWKMERELRKEVKVALDEAKVEIPYPKTQLITK